MSHCSAPTWCSGPQENFSSLRLASSSLATTTTATMCWTRLINRIIDLYIGIWLNQTIFFKVECYILLLSPNVFSSGRFSCQSHGTLISSVDLAISEQRFVFPCLRESYLFCLYQHSFNKLIILKWKMLEIASRDFETFPSRSYRSIFELHTLLRSRKKLHLSFKNVRFYKLVAVVKHTTLYLWMEAIITWDDNWLQTLTTDSWIDSPRVQSMMVSFWKCNYSFATHFVLNALIINFSKNLERIIRKTANQ